ncbi:OmpA family protein [Flavobacterium sp.]|uniref:OmpA family protein n=1 Tax=Flavobacterium sp. TaxID=239 RepID=UPI0037502754
MYKITKNLFLTSIFCFINLATVAQDSFINSDESTTSRRDLNFAISNDIYTIVPTGINSRLSDVGSAFFMDKYIMYSSRRTGAIGGGKDENTNNPYNSLYCVNMDKNGNLSKPYFFASILDSKGNEGGLTFSPDQKKIYYTKSTDTNSKNYQLYKSKFDEECKCKWIEELPASFNDATYSIENPTISSDGTKMYFSSNMPGGYGGYDIYVAEINKDGMPVNPKNLGININTLNDEKFPYISPTNEIYFSSNGHSGFGGLDLFVTKIKRYGYSNPLNLGKTINSEADDISYILASKTKGYVTSNRAGTLGSFDIFRFDVQKAPSIIKGTATEKNSKILLPNTTVNLLDEYDKKVAVQTTKENGSFSFDVNPLESYSIVANKEGYLDFKLPEISSASNAAVVLEMIQKKAVITETALIIENIYFDYNKASLKKESTLSLNKIYDVLVARPEMKITINAYTDARGSDKYNLILSEKRAFEATQYLIKRGIDKDRVEGKGYGESKPLFDCKSNCTEDQYIAERRVEFTIK